MSEEDASVVDYYIKKNEGSNQIFVYWVTFAIPLNNDDDVCYHQYKVPVNKAAKVDSDFFE